MTTSLATWQDPSTLGVWPHHLRDGDQLPLRLPPQGQGGRGRGGSLPPPWWARARVSGLPQETVPQGSLLPGKKLSSTVHCTVYIGPAISTVMYMLHIGWSIIWRRKNWHLPCCAKLFLDFAFLMLLFNPNYPGCCAKMIHTFWNHTLK